ncbi:MAG TPA: hypothetical protein VM598_11235, partial [Bdellovibrionota bacterium]|nr:hypothetical protein [Bdellovibrionota bacterium]
MSRLELKCLFVACLSLAASSGCGMVRDSLRKERISEPQSVAPVSTGGAFNDVNAFRDTVHALATSAG